MRVVLTDQAKADLREIGLFIARHNKTRARSFVREPQAQARDLANTPHSFRATNITAFAAVRTAIT